MGFAERGAGPCRGLIGRDQQHAASFNPASNRSRTELGDKSVTRDLFEASRIEVICKLRRFSSYARSFQDATEGGEPGIHSPWPMIMDSGLAG